MLPTRGCSYEQLADIIRRPEGHWARLNNRFPPVARNGQPPVISLLDSLCQDPLVIDALQDLNIPDPQGQQLAVKKALILLDVCLGQEVIKIFFGLQTVETVIGVFPIAALRSPPHPDVYKDQDIQMSIMKMVFDHLCYQAGGRNPKWYVFDLLNRLNLTYNRHQILLESAMKRLADQPKTIQ